MKGVQIRAADIRDNPKIQHVFESVLPLYKDIMPGVFEENIAYMDLLTEKNLPFSALGLEGWMIESKGKLLGFSALGLLPQNRVYMASLHFLEAERRKGWGTLALTLLEKQYAAQDEMVLMAHEKAPWAVSFYTKNGFKIITKDTLEMTRIMGADLAHLVEEQTLMMGKELETNT